MVLENDSLIEYNYIEMVVEVPQDMQFVEGYWVYKIKQYVDGSADRYKACWMAQGFKQRQDIDYDEIYLAVVRFDISCIIMAITAKINIYIYQIDIDNVYLNIKLKYKLYTKKPTSFKSGKKVY